MTVLAAYRPDTNVIRPAARQVAPDFIRGSAIILMVFGHVTAIGSTAQAQAEAVGWIYTFHMPVFLIISGFFFNTHESPDRKLDKTLRRLVVPYLVFLPLYLIGLIGIQRVGIRTNNAPPASLVDFADIVLLHARGAYWFIHALILLAFCFVLAETVAAATKGGPASIVILFALSLGICIAAGIIEPWVAAYYLVGMALARGNLPIPASLPVGLIGMAASLCLVQISAAKISLAAVAWCLSIISVLASVAEGRTGGFVAFVAWLGRNTLIILLCHAMFIVALKPAGGLFLTIDPTGVLYGLSVTSVTIALCLLTSVVLDAAGASQPVFGVDHVYRPW